MKKSIIFLPIRKSPFGGFRGLAFLFLSLLVTVSAMSQSKYYVTPAGTGSGTSWANASDSLQTIINAAVSGDTILVAAGTYTGGFYMKEGVQVYGGFAGTETYTTQKPPFGGQGGSSILDGGGIQRVLTQASDFTTPTVWAGFTLQNGRSFAGGGAYLMKNGILRNSVVQNNEAFTPVAPPGVRLVQIPGGTFTMGCTSSSNYDCSSPSSEIPTHLVTLSGFYMSESEVTNAQYCAFLNAAGVGSDGKYNVPGFSNLQIIWGETDWGVTYSGGQWIPKSGKSDYPVINVNWYGAYAYCQYYGFRLPTEAEWEYAARGGTNDKAYSGSADNTDAGLGTVGWYSGNNTPNGTKPVKGKTPNAYGLYDMSGNVWEWCSDWYQGDYYSSSPATNPTGPAQGASRVLRGGGWGNFAQRCRVSFRYLISPDYRSDGIGFRVCL